MRCAIGKPTTGKGELDRCWSGTGHESPDRQTETETETETDRDRQRETERQKDRQTDKPDNQSDRHTQTDKQTDGRTETETEKETRSKMSSEEEVKTLKSTAKANSCLTGARAMRREHSLERRRPIVACSGPRSAQGKQHESPSTRREGRATHRCWQCATQVCQCPWWIQRTREISSSTGNCCTTCCGQLWNTVGPTATKLKCGGSCLTGTRGVCWVAPDRCWSGTGLESPFSDSALPCQLQRLGLSTQCLKESKLRNTVRKAHHGSLVIFGDPEQRPDTQAWSPWAAEVEVSS